MDQTELKGRVAEEVARRVQDGQVVGVGTGSTVALAIKKIGARVKAEGLQVSVVPTSIQTAQNCQESGLAVLSPVFEGQIDWGFDGADAVDPDLRLIKGHGGALLLEKVLASKCKEFVVIVDDSKLTQVLAEKCAVPVEVLPEAISIARAGLNKLGATKIVLREGQGKHGPIITEKGNVIFDVTFKTIGADLEAKIKQIVGVIESGIFSNYATEILVASATGIRTIKR